MANDLQKGNLWKRISAGIFDWILTGILAVGIACLLSLLLNYNDYSQSLDQTYAKYEAEYGVTFEISAEQYQSMTDQHRLNYDAAYDALIQDPEAIQSYNMVLNLSMVIITLGILLALVALEFVVPLLLGEGRTLGKKIFGLCLVRTDGVRMNHMQLFVRTILGKFTIETMIPVYILLMLFWGIADLSGTVLLIGLLIAQCVIMAVTRTNSLLHDLLAGTAVVDFASQTIFRTTQDLIDYQKRIAADRAARQTY
jgi:uncharacterized RDD family membrane protein YckC